LIRRAAAIVALLATVPALAACESSQDKNERLRIAAEKAQQNALKSLSIGKPDKRIQILNKEVINGSDGRVAVVVTLKNTSATAIRDVPIGIAVFGSKGGAPFYSNTEAGFGADLNHLSLIRAGQTFEWINDQVTGGKAAKVAVTVGKGVDIKNPPPDAKLVNLRWWNDAVSGWTYKGRAVATGGIDQTRLIIYSTVRQGGQLVAAGRSAIDRLAKGGKPQLVAVLPVLTVSNPTSGAVTATAPPVSFK
jgi:hypothetical protein